MEYQEYSPDDRLSPCIRCFWSLEDWLPSQPSTREKVFPDGCTELIFHYGDRFKKYDGENDFHIQEKSFLHGQLIRYMEIEATGCIGVFSVRFQPAGLQPFISVPVSSLTGKTVTLASLWQEEGQWLEKEVLNATSNQERQNIVEAFLLKKMALTTTGNDLARNFVEALIRTDGNVNAEDLAARWQISKRHLEKTFVSSVGIKPKMLARIIRFNKTLRLIEAGEFNSFTSIACEGGYYDQAHFIKDFKNITGLNPKKYFSEDLVMAKFFNL